MITLRDLSYELSDDRSSCFPGGMARSHLITVYLDERRIQTGKVSGDTDAELDDAINAFLSNLLIRLNA